jgi:hypothetical protein
MRSRDILQLAGACALGLLASLSYSSSATAFAGLSDKQKAYVDEYVHCKILLWTDLAAFDADPACGGTAVETRSIAPHDSGTGTPKPPKDECEYEESIITFLRECPTPQ